MNKKERVNLIKSWIGEVVQHFKGKYYRIIDIAMHTETEEELVIYKALYEDFKIFARPLDMFADELTDEQKAQYPGKKYRLDIVKSVTIDKSLIGRSVKYFNGTIYKIKDIKIDSIDESPNVILENNNIIPEKLFNIILNDNLIKQYGTIFLYELI